ncbi:hypothetical protein [Streptomyces sp. NPDC003247]|uniref:hypothetical protein n=1 Tax=Streptomyces sp. NPDC003247 TaxID=3364677 RepID=UPI00368683B1
MTAGTRLHQFLRSPGNGALPDDVEQLRLFYGVHSLLFGGDMVEYRSNPGDRPHGNPWVGNSENLHIDFEEWLDEQVETYEKTHHADSEGPPIRNPEIIREASTSPFVAQKDQRATCRSWCS